VIRRHIGKPAPGVDLTHEIQSVIGQRAKPPLRHAVRRQQCIAPRHGIAHEERDAHRRQLEEKQTRDHELRHALPDEMGKASTGRYEDGAHREQHRARETKGGQHDRQEQKTERPDASALTPEPEGRGPHAERIAPREQHRLPRPSALPGPHTEIVSSNAAAAEAARPTDEEPSPEPPGRHPGSRPCAEHSTRHCPPRWPGSNARASRRLATRIRLALSDRARFARIIRGGP